MNWWIFVSIGLALLSLVLFWMYSNAKRATKNANFRANLEPGQKISMNDGYVQHSATCAEGVEIFVSPTDMTTTIEKPLYFSDGFKGVEVWTTNGDKYTTSYKLGPGDTNAIQTGPVFFPKGFRFDFSCSK
jgi:hypothetical protein